MPISAASSLPSISILTKKIERKRKNVYDYGKEAKKLSEVEINDKFKYTKSGKLFVLFDTGADDPNRIITLGTEDKIRLLNSEIIWFIYGTFEVSPQPFKQLFSVNLNKNNRNLPCVYGLLPNKQEETFDKFFNLLSPYLTKRQNYILCDYEKAIIKSVGKYFRGTNVCGCYFHLAANIWKHVSN
ncbi:unnamed protein product, partial [Brachionus calyciflorus]